jgi:hypothetical protein
MARSRLKPATPFLAGGAAFGGGEKVLERHVDERRARLSEDDRAVDNLGRDFDPALSLARQPCANEELGIDRDGFSELHGEIGGHRREAVPRREQPAGLVQGRGDEAAVDEPRTGLVPVGELEVRLVLGQPLLLRLCEVDSIRVVAAAPAGRIVMRRDRLRAAAQRRPPRS